MRTIYKIQCYKVACCDECGSEFNGYQLEADAKRHALETGHSPTLTVSYDLTPSDFMKEETQ